MTHPVIGITSKDAKAYCKWLSHKTGHTYRLPTQWEWEWTAAGPQGWKYPWGDQFDKDRCNTKEANVEGTTPVGSYLAGNSLCGASDMIGNVWEISSGSFYSFLLSSSYLFLTALSSSFLLFTLLILLLRFLFFSFFYYSPLASLVALLLFFYLFLFTYFLSLSTTKSTNTFILRGGAWYIPFDKATCFYRTKVTNMQITGFRCLKEVDSIA